VEFIEQISTDQNSFLQLSSREASLFVYKKTIFEINLDVKKNINQCCIEEKDKFNNIDNFLYMYKNIILFCMKHSNFIEIDNLNFISKNLQKYNENKYILDLSILQIECLNLFIEQLIDININITLFFEMLELFIKKINNKKNIYENIKVKILDKDIINHMINEKILMDWLFS
jgi:hypothetical protein